MQVLPPANGKKLWRVKRSVSSGTAGSHEDSSRECLNNSLKISAAGKQFMMKRPPMKRPRTKSGQRKDFVFVDLSPVKSEDDSASVSSSASDASFGSSLSPSHESRSPFSATNESFSCTSSADDDQLQQSLASYDMQTAMFDENTLLGLGLMNVNYCYQQATSTTTQQNHLPFPPRFELPQQPQQQYSSPTEQQYVPCEQYDASSIACESNQLGSPFIASPPAHRRTQSASAISRRRSAGGFQFKSYKGPSNVKKSASRKMKRTMSQPTQALVAATSALPTPQLTEFSTPELQCTATPTFAAAPGFDYFSQMQNNELDYGSDLAYTPVTDFSDSENFSSLLEPINLDVFPSVESENKLYKDDFDFSSFIAI